MATEKTKFPFVCDMCMFLGIVMLEQWLAAGGDGVQLLRCVSIRDVFSFQRVLCTGFNGVGT